MANSVQDLGFLYRVIACDYAELVADPVPRIDAILSQENDPGFTVHRFGGLFEERAEPVMRQSLAALSNLKNLSPKSIAPPADFADVIPRHRLIMAVECAAYHESRLRRHPEDYPPSIRKLMEEGLACPAPEYARTLTHHHTLVSHMNELMEKVDVLMTPATTGPAPDMATTGDPAFNSPWSYTGLPVVSLPFAWTEDGMPLCIQLTSKRWSEDRLLAYAAWCERAIGFQRRVVKLT
jgi:aspartyl-tRNA(Asn)/glutamyl-tRNA(Gln) amidotransferase subunit A